jgi:hypothetical protein
MYETKRIHIVTNSIRQLLNKKGKKFLLVFSVLLGSNQLWAEFGSIVDIGLAGDLYFNNSSANNGQGFVNLLIQNNWSESQLWVDVGAGGLVADAATSYIKAPQLFYRMGNTNRTHVIVGRYRHQWSQLDSFWDLGMTQPLFRWNQAMPEEQGLTGVFVKTPLFSDSLMLTLFGSYLFIPSQGPSFNLSNGKITSSNPWFSDPIEILNLSGEKATVNYDIAIPKTQDVIFKSSIGVQLATPDNKKGFQFNSFFLNKPRNDLVLPFEGFLNLTTFNADIKVAPQVARHSVAGLDFGWQTYYTKTVLSWLYESKVNFQAPDNSTFPIIPEQNIFSLQEKVRLTSSQRMWLGYIYVNREDNKTGGVFSNSSISTFLNRNRFDEALQIKWEGLLFKTDSQYRVKATLSYVQSIKRDNIWLNADLRWSAYKGFEVFTRLDFFGGSTKTIASYDFLSTYQNNDRILIGGHYAF